MRKMIRKWIRTVRKLWNGERENGLDLRLFGDGAGGGAGAGAGAGTGDGGAAPSAVADEPIQEGTLPDGTKVDRRLAERMERQRKRHPERSFPAAQPGNANEPPTQQAPQNPDEEWQSLKKGKFAEQYGRDVQAAIQDRFRNQADLQGQLNQMRPMLDALCQQRGINPGDYAALSNAVLNDDSLYEDDAEAAGMTVEAYKSYKALEAEANAARQRQAMEQQQASFNAHLQNLARQGEELKKVFPNFDLMTELNNPNFRRMTAPDVGLSVSDAYYACHHAELQPQAVMAGVQHAQRQIAQSLQANASRPVEGAMSGNQQAAKIAIDVKHMTREQRQQLKEELSRRRARGENATLD